MKSLNSIAALSLVLLLTQASASDDLFLTTPAMRTETKLVLRHIENQHFLRKPVEEIDMEAFVEAYVGELDDLKLFFTHTEVEGFKQRYAPSMVTSLNSGRLHGAFEMFADFRENADRRFEWIFSRLNQPFDFTEEQTYMRDRSEASWPATRELADALWERRLKYELLNEMLNDIEDQAKEADDAEEAAEETEAEGTTETVEAEVEVELEAQTFEESLAEAIKSVRKRYERLRDSFEEMEAQEVQEIFLTSLLGMYDPHSTFMSANTVEEFEIAMQNSLVGIGAVLTQNDGYCTIRELIPKGPASKSGKLQSGDQIVGVGQGKTGAIVDTIGMKLDKVVKMIRGEKGTIVRLLIQPADSDPSNRHEVQLVRDHVKLTSKLATAEIFQVPAGDRTVPVGVIDLPAFYGEDASGNGSRTSSDVEELIVKLKDAGTEGLILDLRSNGGGLLNEAVELTGLFIPEGPVVQVKSYQGSVDQLADENPKVAWDGPLLVLISRYSASASEIAAGALQSHHRAVVVGDSETHGKGTVQAVYRLSRSRFSSTMFARKGAVKITVQKFYLPDGSSTQLRGVRSDIALPSYNSYLPIGEGDLTNALKWDALSGPYGPEKFSAADDHVSEDLLEHLRLKSSERQEELEEFDYLRDYIDWFGKGYEQKKYSLNLEKRKLEREAESNYRDSLNERLDALEALEYDATEVALNLADEEDSKATVTESILEGATDAEEADESPKPDGVDIHLRESLRIIVDWIKYDKDAQAEAKKLKDIAANSAG